MTRKEWEKAVAINEVNYKVAMKNKDWEKMNKLIEELNELNKKRLNFLFK